ncbi:hypothetical protein BLA60_10290 [Actinophytocola xinjiangensis]|uniref:IclR family transcriptional regulator n=1 Tax=Actinophytocola xinjiangensis TaxID=485602 RepID=A0A7Z0WPK4_9PSEU|nr:hypothetical protein BLA60_10290 [Actinophytocola xinjiangensis]
MSRPGDQVPGEIGAVRTLRVLTYLSKRSRPVSAGTIARDCDIPRSSLYRILRVMERMYFVVHLPEDELWGIGIGAFEIGSGYLRSGVLERSGRPLLVRLTRRTGMVSHLGVLHGSDVLYLLKQTTDEPARPFVTAVGVRLPAHLTAMGRAMLAQLPAHQVRAILWRPGELVTRTGRGPRHLSELREILRADRSRGYSVESSSTTEEVSCVAAAVFDHEGLPIAAVGVSYYDLPSAAEVERIASAVRETADGLTTRLSGTPVRRRA